MADSKSWEIRAVPLVFGLFLAFASWPAARSCVHSSSCATLKNNQPFGDGPVDDELCRRFFLQPQQTVHRRYEALRAYFLDGRPLAEIADHFGYRRSSLKSLVCRFRAACGQGTPAPFFFPIAEVAPAAGAAPKTQTGQNAPRPPTSGS
jgi:hypothetical protein